MLARLVDEFVHNSLHTVTEDWRPASEPHEVLCSAPADLDVYVKLVEATSVGCKLDVVLCDDKKGSGNCS